MKVALCQINTTVADLDGNRERILEAYRKAEALGAELVVFPEMAIPGYPALDLLDRASFRSDCERCLEQVAAEMTGPPAIVGNLRSSSRPLGRNIHNTAAVIVSGEVTGYRDKMLLPTYDVFDEDRYFEPGASVLPVPIAGRSVGIAICEDLWNLADFAFRKPYAADPPQELRDQGVEFIVCPSASPFHRSKAQQREQLIRDQARRLGIPVLLCNLVGGNTELVFDGNSLAASREGAVRKAASFEEDLLLVDTQELSVESPSSSERDTVRPSASASTPETQAEEMSDALVLGVRDYFAKCGFGSAVIGLSGGIDSAVTAVIACDALGADRVQGLAMPSRYSSDGSLEDARDLAQNLGMQFDEVSIEPIFRSYLESLAPLFGDRPADVTEENLQARIRGALLMAASNKFGRVLLTTGNKSELAVGYCTIYGDMAGGLAVIGDVPKTDVYRIAELPAHRDRIPRSTREKPPSAELRPDQRDQDSLPPYDVLDPILEAYVEKDRSPEEIAAQGFDADLVGRIVKLVEHNEYKRRQAAPTIRVTPRAFGMGRRFPIARHF